MKRLNLKLGDVFLVNIDVSRKKYFQYIANDSLQLSSNVIKAFKSFYTSSDEPDLEDVIKDEVEFTAHCIIRLGFKLDL